MKGETGQGLDRALNSIEIGVDRAEEYTRIKRVMRIEQKLNLYGVLHLTVAVKKCNFCKGEIKRD